MLDPGYCHPAIAPAKYVRSPFTTFSHAKRDRSFGIVPVDRPLPLFHARRAIALLASKGRSPFTAFSQGRAIALLARKGRSPFTTFSLLDGRSPFLVSLPPNTTYIIS